jgi:MFS family permease
MQTIDRSTPRSQPNPAAGIAALLTALLAGADMAALATTLPRVVNDLTSGIETYAWPFFLYMAAFIAAMPFWGLITGRLGRKWVALIGAVVYILGSLLATVAGQFVILVACRVVQGAGLGAMMPALYSLAMENDARWTRAIPCVALFGGIAGGPLAWWLVHTAPWSRLFGVEAALALVVALAVLVTGGGIRDRQTLARHVATQLDQAAASFFHVFAMPATLMLSGLLGFHPELAEGEASPVALPRGSAFKLAAGMSIVMGAATVTMMVFLPVHLQGSAGLPLWTTAVAMALIGVGMPLGTGLGARSHRVFGTAGLARSGLGIATLAAVGTAALRPMTATALGWLIFMPLFGLGMGLAHAGILAYVRERLPADRRGPGLGLLMAFRSIGGPFGTGLVGAELAAVLAFTLMPLEKANRFLGPQHGADLLPRISNDLLPLLQLGTAVCQWTIAGLTATAALLAMGWRVEAEEPDGEP